MRAFLVHTSAFALQWWNLTNNVGMGAPNNPDDVQLVQFGFFCLGMPTSRTRAPQFRPVYARVVPGSAYAAADANDLLNLAIQTLEFQSGLTQRDRRINPLPEGRSTYQDSSGRHPYLLAYLLNAMYDAVGQANWPRLDRHATCPPLVATAVRNACTLP